MVRFFQAVFGWFPGGLTVMAVLVCAFFTTFTGASGRDHPAPWAACSPSSWRRPAIRKRFTVGLLTASGSRRAALPAEPAGHHLRRDLRQVEHQGHVHRRDCCRASSWSSRSWPSASCIRRKTRMPRGTRSSSGKRPRAFGDSFWELLLPRPRLRALLRRASPASRRAPRSPCSTSWSSRPSSQKDIKIRELPAHLPQVPCPSSAACSSSWPWPTGLSYYVIDAADPA
ncbi:MAG: hypothetical protein MZU84_06230 [Sphingobacterium sp.]|nr:hypothetical protein [Sphingobacterium sp.]